MLQTFADTAFDNLSFTAAPVAPFQVGQLLQNTYTFQQGVIVEVEYSDLSGQFVFTVLLPTLTRSTWRESVVKASQSAAAVMIGSLVIAIADDKSRHQGQVVDKRNGDLIVRFAD